MTPVEPVAAAPTARRFARLRRAAAVAGVPLLLAGVATAGGGGLVRVHHGDTLWAIARGHHMSVRALQELNGLPGDVIYPGQVLRVTGEPRPGAGPQPVLRDYPAATLRSASSHRAALAGRAQPSREYIRGLIVAEAQRAHVDPALALAVAWQESGWSQNAVSSADALGVMQVLPSSSDWVARNVVHRRLDPLDARDNVVAGVRLLAALTKVAPTESAVAGYYQGLSSVRAHGQYADTRRYVGNVLSLRQRYS